MEDVLKMGPRHLPADMNPPIPAQQRDIASVCRKETFQYLVPSVKNRQTDAEGFE